MAAEVAEAENVNSGVEVMDEVCLFLKLELWACKNLSSKLKCAC